MSKFFQRLCIVAGILAIGGLGLLAWHKHTKATVVLPSSVSSKLLFTPYTPQSLPSGLSFNKTSPHTKEGALFFAVQSKTVVITFSEQAVPKSYDLNTFYDASISSPARLDVKPGTAVYGQTYNKQGNIISYTTSDNTWIIMTSIGSVSKATALQLIKSLKAQP
jgi:hypothetical protein